MGKWSNLTNIFQMGWNHQPVWHLYFVSIYRYIYIYIFFFKCCYLMLINGSRLWWYCCWYWDLLRLILTWPWWLWKPLWFQIKTSPHYLFPSWNEQLRKTCVCKTFPMFTFVVMHIIYNTHISCVYIYIIHPYTPYIQYFINLSRLLFWEAIKKHLLRLFVCCPEKLKADPCCPFKGRVASMLCSWRE